ncbi:MAG TPA: GrpB family protein, partial [Clostridiales bacterium]|nr:GrpB family protein [Clostridiales bacterium]
MIGLKRGEVLLSDHRPEWKELAAVTLNDLKKFFGETARDIQHIGSTAICNIKAKPIIDIAVGVESFDTVVDILLHLDESGVYKRSHNRFRNDYLYVVHDDEDRRTHQIHILKIDSPQWHNYIDFRDYVNYPPP